MTRKTPPAAPAEAMRWVRPPAQPTLKLRDEIAPELGRFQMTGGVLEPIPETSELIDELREFHDSDLLLDLQQKAAAVRDLVPELVGLSLGVMKDGAAFTLVATDTEVAVLDAIQYIAGGPCVDALPAERVIVYDSDGPDDEGQWQTFARATAAKAVATTLTLPILGSSNAVVGTVNLYAAVPGAFRGLHQQIATIFSAWAPGAVANADLSFETRRTAERAPGLLRVKMQVEAAVGVLMADHGVDADAARDLLHQAAQRAGVTIGQLAQTMLEEFEDPEGS